MQRHLGGRQQPAGLRVAKITQPIIERPTNGGGKLRFDLIRAGGVGCVGAEHHADVETFQIHCFDHIHWRAMILSFTPPKFLVSFLGPRPANRDVFLTPRKIRSNGNRALTDLPQAFPRFRWPRTAFDKFRLEIAEPEILGFNDMNVGIDYFESLLGHEASPQTSYIRVSPKSRRRNQHTLTRMLESRTPTRSPPSLRGRQRGGSQQATKSRRRRLDHRIFRISL